MEIVSAVDIVTTNSAVASPAPVKICLHVLKEARDDVRAMRTAAALMEAGYAVCIVDLEAKSPLPIEESIQGVPVQHLIIPSWHTSRRFELRFFIKAVQVLFLSVLRLIKTRVDIYHACELTALPASFIAATLRRKPLIFEVYDLQFPVPDTGVGFWKRLAWLIRLIHAVIIPRCAGVIVTSPLHAQEIYNRFHPKEIALVRNTPSYREVAVDDPMRRYLVLEAQTRIALYHGTLQADRGLDRLVRAAKFLERDIVIVMQGNSEGTIRDELEALIDKAGVADRVKILPRVPFEELLNWTAHADIGLIIYSPDSSLNIRTHLPNKLFEYLMAGLPVLSSQLDAVAEVIRTYDVGQVVPSVDPAAIAEAINTMLADRVALDRMHLNALNAAKRDLCWDKEKQQVIHFYQKILSNARSTQLREVSMNYSESKRKSRPLPPESQVEERY